MFCASLDNYIKINNYNAIITDMGNNIAGIDFPDGNTPFRLKIITPVMLMANVKLYNELKNKNPALVKEVENLIYYIDVMKNKYHNFKAFAWELEGYGFEKVPDNSFPAEVVEEQLKLVDLLLSCHYWIS